MKFSRFNSMSIRPFQLGSAALALVMLCALASCGGGGVVPATGVQLRALSAQFAARKSVSYSPFRTLNRDTETVTAAQIKQDLDLLIAGKFTLLRLFDSSDNVSKLTLQVIRDNHLDVKVMLGVYIQGNNDAFNQAEIARGVALAQAYSDTVLAVSIGNETMVNWSFNPSTPAAMAAHIKTVRSQISQPVTTDDNWAFYASAPSTITDAIDFASIHTYPLADSVHNPHLWDWQQASVPAATRAVAMMDAAIVAAKKDYSTVRSYLDGKGLSKMPIVIGETGWKAIASGGETFRAHPVNQKMYFDRLSAWSAQGGTGPISIVYFEAFDEPWKNGDDNWALFNVNRQARYLIQSLYPASQWEAGTYSAADAVYYVPVVANAIITANRYASYADIAVAGEARPVETPVFNAWDGTTASYPEVSSSSAPADPSHSIEITPKPALAGWGWGVAQQLPTTADDLSNFGASGFLNFSIKTNYPGKIEVGFMTGSTTAGSAFDVYLPLAPGSYGYLNDGNWHQVSIPISAIVPHGAMAFGMTDASKAKLDLSRVTSPFVIADRYANTGKAQNSNDTTKLNIDAVFWSK